MRILGPYEKQLKQKIKKCEDKMFQYKYIFINNNGSNATFVCYKDCLNNWVMFFIFEIKFYHENGAFII